jgi:hypothetical protein
MTIDDEVKARHYRDRGECFLRAMRLVSDESLLAAELRDYMAAAALLAVHSAIAFADAILTLRTGERSTAQDHKEAVSKLRKVCDDLRRDASGIGHLSKLLASKDHFAYGDRRVTSPEIESAMDQVDRFARWVYRTFPELAAGEQA